MEYEWLWDLFGISIAGAAILSAISTFVGQPIYVETLTLTHLLTHIVVMVIGFALTEGGVLKVYTRTLAALSSILG